MRTTRVDVSALVRSTPLQRGRSGGGGSFGLGLAPAIDGFEMNDVAPLRDGEAPGYPLRTFKVGQPGAAYELIEDAGGRFELASLDGGETAFVDEDGYAYLSGTGLTADIADVEYTVIIRVTLGTASRDYTRTVTVEEALAIEPFDYDVIAQESSFEHTLPEGTELIHFSPADGRLNLVSITIVNDADNIFDVPAQTVYLTRGAGTVVDDSDVEVTLEFAFGGDGEDTATTRQQTYTFSTFSIG